MTTRQITKTVSMKGQTYEVTADVDKDLWFDVNEIIWLKEIENQKPLRVDVTEMLMEFTEAMNDINTYFSEQLDGSDFTGDYIDYIEVYND